MTHPPRRHRREATPWAIGAAVLVHLGVIGGGAAFGISLGGGAASSTESLLADEDVVALETSCTGDVLLATGARLALCLAPWRSGELAACRDEAMVAMWMDLSACQPTGEVIAAAPIEMLPPRELEKLTPIEPEALLDALKPEDKKEPPPKPPEQQVAQPKQAPPPPPPAPPRPQQVVETAKPNTEQEPENTRFLSEHNVKVDKQTVARGAVDEPMVAKSQPKELTPKNDPKESAIKELKPEAPGRDAKAPQVPGSLAMRAPGAPQVSEAPQEAKTRGQADGMKGPLVADGFLPRHGTGAIEQMRRDPGELTRGGEGGAGGGAPPVPNLRPSDEVLERAIGGGSVDHLEEVEDGDETSLSSKRWVYASFFNRMKRQVAMNWNANGVRHRVDPTGSVYGFKTRVTVVRVTLDARGGLEKIVVTTPSGFDALDDEAVRAFRAAAPFPNPPGGLLTADGRITFEFGFHSAIEAPRTSWRVLQSM